MTSNEYEITFNDIANSIQDYRFNLDDELYYADPLTDEIHDKLIDCEIMLRDVIDMINKCEFLIEEDDEENNEEND